MHELFDRNRKLGLLLTRKGRPPPWLSWCPPGVPVNLRGEGRDPLAHRGGFS